MKIIEQLHLIRAKNLLNTGVQTYVKTYGDAFINPINYTLKELYEMQKFGFKTDKKGFIITNQEKYKIPNKK